MKCSARELVSKLRCAGKIIKHRQNKERRKTPSLFDQAADMILDLTCTVHRERRLKHIMQGALIGVSIAFVLTLLA